MTRRSPARSQAFPRSRRLRKRPDFLRVQRRGHRRVLADLVVVYRWRPADEASERVRVGFTVSKKVGNAVVRNRVKRRLRESVRRSWELLDRLDRSVDVVIIARSSAARADSAALLDQVRTAFTAIGRSR